MVGGSLRVLRLLPPQKLVAMILLKVALKHQKLKQNKNLINTYIHFLFVVLLLHVYLIDGENLF
jgi:hypothetical protein